VKSAHSPSKTSASPVSSLRASHQVEITELQAAHDAEIERVRAEAQGHQRRTSQLDTVEEKIATVQAALEASRDEYSTNEEQMRATIEEKEADRLELGRVVQELQVEIDRCQLKLDKEAKVQAKEKKIAQDAAARLEAELEELRVDALAKEQELNELKQSYTAEAKTALEEAEQLRQELEALRSEASAKDEEIARLEAASAAEAETAAEQLQLQKELEKQKRVAQTRYDELRIIKDANHVLQKELKDVRAANGIPEIETPMTETSDRELGNGMPAIEPQADALKLLGLQLEHQKREADGLRDVVAELQDLAKDYELKLRDEQGRTVEQAKELEQLKTAHEKQQTAHDRVENDRIDLQKKIEDLQLELQQTTEEKSQKAVARELQPECKDQRSGGQPQGRRRQENCA
jgi:hypothetical protein